MIRQKTTKKTRPDKPYPGFPLFPHRNGSWARKIAGKAHYFGPWADWKAALAEHDRLYPYLKAGVATPSEFSGVTVGDLCNLFLVHKRRLLATGEITERWYEDLKEVCELVIATFRYERIAETLTPKDFATLRESLVKAGRSPGIAKNKINRIRSIFKFGEKNDYLERRTKYGTEFDPPTKGHLRKYRNARPEKLLTPSDIKSLAKSAGVHLRAMIYLAANAGLNNTDVCKIQISAINLESGWVDFPRTKTGVKRRFCLWPETIAAIKESLKGRPTPTSPDDSEFLFITKYGNSWHPRDSLAAEFGKLRDRCNVDASFQYFRHTFETVAGETRDQVAVDCVMGHADYSMAGEYRERIDDVRLLAVTNHVRTWLFGKKGGAK